MIPAPEQALRVVSAHPSLPGHFPGSPVVPGVVLLSELLAQLQRVQPELLVTGIKKLKFLRMVLPDESFLVEFSEPGVSDIRFKGWRDGEKIFEGHLLLRAAAHHG